MAIVISGTGLFTPEESISNAELVASFNLYADEFNKINKVAIALDEVEEMTHSSVEFIEKASGIKRRNVLNKTGILNPSRMKPELPHRSDSEQSVMCEIAVAAAAEAIAEAKKSPQEIDMVLVACSNMQRAYPAIAIEVQNALGASGFGYDMNVACSSATFALQTASDALRGGSATCVLIVNPEICSGHLNFKNRDCHFIFGDACTAMIVEHHETAKSHMQFKILGTKLYTEFSNNIRNNHGYLTRCFERQTTEDENLFKQEGRKVFKDVVPTVIKHITTHAEDCSLPLSKIKRYYLHQANQHMNDMIAKKLCGESYSPEKAPLILDEFANTSSAGSIIAFHKYKHELSRAEMGIICSFGAGYSVGSILLERV
jgi:beta-ketodecanoyl-[acyl-carrier-protein] synthase